jgi:hypothetical protein
VVRQRTVHLVLAAVALYELRSLVRSVAPALRAAASFHAASAGLWLMALSALALGAALWQTGRGLGRVARPPRWGLRLVGLWLMLGSALLVVLSTLAAVLGHGTVGQLLGASSGWADAPVAASLGLCLAVSIEAGPWWAGRAFGLAVSAVFAASAPRRAGPSAGWHPGSGPAPLLAGWSDRGPPRVA